MNPLTKEFKEKLNQLQDDVASKEVQVALLESEMTDTVMPSMILSQIKSIVMEMQFDVLKFEKEKGKSEKSAFGKERLSALMGLVERLDGISNANYNLKGANRRIHTNYQILRVENRELRGELKKIADAEAFLADK